MDEQGVDEVLADYMAEQNARRGETTPAPRERHHHRDYPLFLRYVTQDVITGFCQRTGDTNPLWQNEEYASQTPWQGTIAPPMLISGVAAVPDPPEVPGWAPMFAGNVTRLIRPLRHGDVLDADDVWLGIDDLSKPDRPHRTFLMKAERRFRNQRDEPVGSLLCRVVCTVPRTGHDAAPDEAVQQRRRPRYTEEQLSDIYSHYDEELLGKFRRGAMPRYWEDVGEGEDVAVTIKGPLDVIDQAALGTGLVAHAYKWELIRGEKLHSPRDPETNAYQFQMAWHFHDGLAQSLGMPYAIAFGASIEHWLGHAVTNWMGDHAFMRELDARMTAPMFVGETMWISGKVVRRYEEDDRGLVELRLRGVEHTGIELASARAIVQLPHRGQPEEVVNDVLRQGGRAQSQL